MTGKTHSGPHRGILLSNEKEHVVDMHTSSCCGSVETNLTSIQEDVVSTPGLTQWVKDRCCMSCGAGRSPAPNLLWLWHRLAAAVPIQPLTWESPYACRGCSPKTKKKKKKKKICISAWMNLQRITMGKKKPTLKV